MTANVLLITALAACTYDVRYEECAIHCSADTGCPGDLTCGPEGLCRVPGETCSNVLSTFPSCVGLAATCGPTGSDDCCSTALPIPGGLFFRSYDTASDGMYVNANYPATVSAFRLDKYEVTVGRFRKFVDAGMGTQTVAPLAGDGAHAKIAGSGWDADWSTNLAINTAALIGAMKCDAPRQTWTDAPSANEELPINCVTWYEAFAFCAWDGGFLPTEAEWNYAAAGGAEQRAFPWSSPAGSTVIDCAHANYQPGPYCTNPAIGAVNRAGSESPRGDSKYGQADLSGNVSEWTLDWYQSSYPNPCDACADLTPALYRVFRGGGFYEGSSSLRGAFRNVVEPTRRFDTLGLRCARTP